MAFAIYFGINSASFNFDTRNQAAGKTIFLENGGDLQTAINEAGPSDAIFLKPGSYTANSTSGFNIVGKTIRILGSGEEFTTIVANNKDYGFLMTGSKVSFESLKISGATRDGINAVASGNSEITLRDVNVIGNSGAGINSAKSTVQQSLFDQNGEGIKTSGPLVLENTTVQNSAANGVTVTSTGATENTIRNVVALKNVGTAISLNGGNNKITNVTLSENGNGILEITNSTQTTVTNSIISKSKGEGLSFKNESSTVKYSDSFGNETSNFNPATLSNLDGNLSTEPGFVSSTSLQLTKQSSLRNKGVTDQKNADGSRVDMGAFGGNPNLTASNTIPTISSTPPEYVKPGETYSYEIQASDQDGDALSYVVLNNNIPSWLKQEGNKFIGTPKLTDVGYYGVMVVVTDLKGGNVVHPISINVIPNERDIPPSTNTNPSPTPTPVSSVVTPKVTITSPSATSVFTKDNREITWSVNTGAQIESYEVKYSSDGQNFTSLVKLPGNVTSYSWNNIESLVSGKYFVRVEATDKGTPPVTVGATSQQFEINNNQPSGTEAITITKNSPADNDVVISKRQLIVVEFRPDADIDKEQTTLTVNGQNVTYETTRNTIFYQTATDYPGSSVTVEVQLITTKGGKASKKWQFNIQGTTNPQDTTPEVTNNDTIFGLPRNIGLGILGCLVLILLILILYFVVRFIKTIRDEREGNLDAEFTEYYEPAATGTALSTTQESDVTPATPVQPEEDMSQYYSEETAQTPSIEEYTEQNSEVTNSENQDQTGNVQNESTQFTDGSEDDQSQQQTTTEETPEPVQSDQEVENQDQTTYNDQQPAEELSTGSNDDAYIEQLKNKYDVKDEQIEQYNETQNSSVDQLSSQSAGGEQNEQIDPTQASTPPDKQS